MTATSRREREEDEYSDAPAPPDGGWGWVIVFASFMVHMIFDGVTYSFGIFYDDFLDYFQDGKGITSWILSILVGVTNCSGPIASILVNKYGGRAVTIAGAVLSAACLIASYYAQDVLTLCGTIGLGLGFGFGLMYLPAIVCVTIWFEKKRSLATGIAVCGSGVGTFIFAPLVTKLLALYGWRVSLLVVAAIVLTCAVFGSFFRPLETKHIEVTRKPTLASIPELPELTEEEIQRIQPAPGPRRYSQEDISKFVARKSRTKTVSLSFSVIIDEENYRHGPLDKPDIFYQGELMNIPAYRYRAHEGTPENRRLSSFSYKRRKSSAIPQKSSVCCIPCAPESKHLLLEMLDLALFKNPIFIIFLFSNFLTCLGFNIPYVYIVPRAKTFNITSDEAGYLISVIGIANTVGRIVLGFVCDIRWINRKQVYIWCLITCGLATIAGGFFEQFYALAVYCCVFGFTIGAYVGLSSVILVDLIGLEKLTNAFGHVLLFSGVGALIGSPIAGWLYDISGSYDPAFYFGGAVIFASGAILFLIYAIQNWKDKMAQEVAEDVIPQTIAQSKRTFSV